MEGDVTLSRILERKGTSVLTGAGDLTLAEAARRMVQASVGSLVVLDEEGAVEGILTERDILRSVAASPDRLEATRVSDAMTRDVLAALPTDTVEQAMALMTRRHLRHLPVVDDGRLAGLVSIGDLVKALADEDAAEVRLLRDYIRGAYPG